MKSLPQLTWLRKGSAVPAGTQTARFNGNPDNIRSGARAAQDVDVVDWLGGTRSAMVIEEVVGLGRYGKTLTVLSSESIGQERDDDEEDDDDLSERWTPQFRR